MPYAKANYRIDINYSVILDDKCCEQFCYWRSFVFLLSYFWDHVHGSQNNWPGPVRVRVYGSGSNKIDTYPISLSFIYSLHLYGLCIIWGEMHFAPGKWVRLATNTIQFKKRHNAPSNYIISWYFDIIKKTVIFSLSDFIYFDLLFFLTLHFLQFCLWIN